MCKDNNKENGKFLKPESSDDLRIRTDPHFNDHLYKLLLGLPTDLRLKFLNWMFGTCYTGNETVHYGPTVEIAGDGHERLADSHLVVETSSGRQAYNTECNTDWKPDLYERVSEYSLLLGSATVVSLGGGAKIPFMNFPRPGILLLHHSRIAPESFPIGVAVGGKTIAATTVPVRQLGNLGPQDIIDHDLGLLIPLYLAKYSRQIKEDMGADLIDRIEAECAQLYNYLKRLHNIYRLDVNTYVRLVSLSEAAIKHYAAKSPSLEGVLIRHMESMFVGTEITRALDANFQEGEASGFRKGEASGFQKGEASGFQKGEASGFQKGKASGLREVFSGLMHHGYSIAEISGMTGIPVNEIMNIF